MPSSSLIRALSGMKYFFSGFTPLSKMVNLVPKTLDLPREGHGQNKIIIVTIILYINCFPVSSHQLFPSSLYIRLISMYLQSQPCEPGFCFLPLPFRNPPTSRTQELTHPSPLLLRNIGVPAPCPSKKSNALNASLCSKTFRSLSNHPGVTT